LKFMAIIELTFRESFYKKTFLGFLAISTFIILLFLFALNLDIVNGAQSAVSLFGIQAPELVDIDIIVAGVEGVVSVMLFTIGIFMSLFATSSLIPSLLQPGFIDLFISKPVNRLQILGGRFMGAITIVTFNIFYLIILTWFIISIKSGLWNWNFLLAGLVIVFTFAVLFSMMTFLGTISKSGPFSLMITYLILFFSPILLQRDQIYALLSSRYYGYIFDGFYYFLPKTAELGKITTQLARGLPVDSWMPVWTSFLFLAFMFLISAYIFQRKDF
jgi:ABC-type transport system involved in multi-copper enzyme maturation permease subunit